MELILKFSRLVIIFIKFVLSTLYLELKTYIIRVTKFNFDFYKRREYSAFKISITFFTTFMMALVSFLYISENNFIQYSAKGLILASISINILSTLWMFLCQFKNNKNDNLSKYYLDYSIMHLSLIFDLLIITYMLSLLVNSLNLNIMVWIMYLPSILGCYCYFRYFIIKKLNLWGSFVFFFLASPIISILVFGLIIELTAQVFRFYPYSDRVQLWNMLLGSIILINYLIMVVPNEKIREVKVALYFIIAIFTTFSYCLFLKDVIANILIDSGFVDASMRKVIEDELGKLLKGLTLPYLIGGTIGAFLIELKERNLDKKNTSSNTSITGNSSDVIALARQGLRHFSPKGEKDELR